jgi:hypothetical protein
LCELSPQRSRIDEVDERPLAADLDDRQPLAVARLEGVVAVDRDLGEAVLAELREERRARSVAEVTAAAAVERYG